MYSWKKTTHVFVALFVLIGTGPNIVYAEKEDDRELFEIFELSKIANPVQSYRALKAANLKVGNHFDFDIQQELRIDIRSQQCLFSLRVESFDVDKLKTFASDNWPGVYDTPEGRETLDWQIKAFFDEYIKDEAVLVYVTESSLYMYFLKQWKKIDFAVYDEEALKKFWMTIFNKLGDKLPVYLRAVEDIKGEDGIVEKKETDFALYQVLKGAPIWWESLSVDDVDEFSLERYFLRPLVFSIFEQVNSFCFGIVYPYFWGGIHTLGGRGGHMVKQERVEHTEVDKTGILTDLTVAITAELVLNDVDVDYYRNKPTPYGGRIIPRVDLVYNAKTELLDYNEEFEFPEITEYTEWTWNPVNEDR